MISERTLIALTPAQHDDDVEMHKLHDWINRAPVIQFALDDFTGDPAVDLRRMMQAVKDQTAAP
jgi:hypothetical protein